MFVEGFGSCCSLPKLSIVKGVIIFKLFFKYYCNHIYYYCCPDKHLINLCFVGVGIYDIYIFIKIIIKIK